MKRFVLAAILAVSVAGCATTSAPPSTNPPPPASQPTEEERRQAECRKVLLGIAVVHAGFTTAYLLSDKDKQKEAINRAQMALQPWIDLAVRYKCDIPPPPKPPEPA